MLLALNFVMLRCLLNKLNHQCVHFVSGPFSRQDMQELGSILLKLMGHSSSLSKLVSSYTEDITFAQVSS